MLHGGGMTNPVSPGKPVYEQDAIPYSQPEILSEGVGVDGGAAMPRHDAIRLGAADGRMMGDPVRAHVLVVDDEPLAVRGLASFLARKGYRVTTARDGHDALDAFRADPAAVVVTDIRMPGLDGWGLVHALRGESPGAYIIVVTGYPGAEDSEAAAGADLVMRKPLDLRAISEAIGSVVGQSE